jgi:hypothetical protein
MATNRHRQFGYRYQLQVVYSFGSHATDWGKLASSAVVVLTNPVLGIVLGLLLGALAVSGRFSLIAADILLAGAVLVAAIGIVNANLPDRRLTASAILAIVAVGLFLSYWIEPTNQKALATSSVPTPTNTEAPQLATLKQLFENDWPDLPAYYSVSTLASPKPGKSDAREFSVPWRLTGDFVASSKFLGFFFDSNLSPADAVDLCIFLSDHYQQFIDAANAQVDITAKWPADSAVTHLKDLTFSKRIFIYYRNSDFTLPQMGSVQVLYEQQGLTVQFRGADYEWIHRTDHPAFRPKPLTPGAVLLPRALGTGLEIKVTKLSP